MRGPEARTKPLWGNTRGLHVVALAPVPTLVELRDADRLHVQRVRADEAGMDAEVDERRPVLQDARDFAHCGREVVEVAVGEDRDGGVEGRILERELRCVGAHNADFALAGAPQHVLRDVDAGHSPAELRERRRVRSRPAAEVEELPRTLADERLHDLPGVPLERRRLEFLVVPVREPVIARDHHPMVVLQSALTICP